MKTPRTDHTTPDLHTLHWLPINARTKYKMFSLCFGAITSPGPGCCLPFWFTQDLHALQATSIFCRRLYTVHTTCPPVKTKSYDEHSFSYIAPILLNTLPKEIRFSQSASSFKSALKSHLFPTWYWLVCVCVCACACDKQVVCVTYDDMSHSMLDSVCLWSLCILSLWL